jgi:MFS family permease
VCPLVALRFVDPTEAVVFSIAPLAAPPTSNDDRRRHAPGWTLALASLGSFMVVLDALVVAIPLTSIEDLAWTVDPYTTGIAVLLMAGAALGDRYGRAGYTPPAAQQRRLGRRVTRLLTHHGTYIVGAANESLYSWQRQY